MVRGSKVVVKGIIAKKLLEITPIVIADFENVVYECGCSSNSWETYYFNYNEFYEKLYQL
ncbi:hypothetical protein FRX31_027840 [Thalictrum thalictroides]|uniref:Uncharacterized protein n=1 Tax=Thalictrum thalictroides TaxID=46969 RepID=A0A7J6VEB9_THATH|nr:hypothetical protein FRX31_027840 [Thalictrum thalictroides]